MKFYTQCVISRTSLILWTSVISHTRVILHTNIILHTSVILHTSLILHTEWNSTHTVKFYTHSVMLLLRTVYNFQNVYNSTQSVKFYTQCIILHKVYNFTHSVYILHIIWYVNLSFRMQVYAVLSWGNFCRAFTHFQV